MDLVCCLSLFTNCWLSPKLELAKIYYYAHLLFDQIKKVEEMNVQIIKN